MHKCKDCVGTAKQRWKSGGHRQHIHNPLYLSQKRIEHLSEKYDHITIFYNPTPKLKKPKRLYK